VLVKCGDLACVFADLVMGFWFRGMNWLHIGKKGCFDVCLCPFFLGVFFTYVLYLPDAERLDTFPSVLRIIVFLF